MAMKWDGDSYAISFVYYVTGMLFLIGGRVVVSDWVFFRQFLLDEL